jgi:hypothetical protein
MPNAGRRRALRRVLDGQMGECIAKCLRRTIRPPSQHYGYGEVCSATTKSDRRKMRGSPSRRSVKIPLRCNETQNRTVPTGALRLISVASLSAPHCVCRAWARLVFNAAALCCLIRGHPYEHHTVAHTHHRQPGRRRSRQTHPRRHALWTLGDGQQPDPPASLAARALSRDGVRVRAHRAGALGLRRGQADRRTAILAGSPGEPPGCVASHVSSRESLAGCPPCAAFAQQCHGVLCDHQLLIGRHDQKQDPALRPRDLRRAVRIGLRIKHNA